jgi:hypothetical protein
MKPNRIFNRSLTGAPSHCVPASVPSQPAPAEARLSAMVTDSPDSFLLGLHISNVPIKALLDSGATHCFIDTTLVSDHRLPATLLPQPMRLCLFDGSYAPEPIIYQVTIPVHFTPAKVLAVNFLVTPLDPDVSAVIGLRWLRHHNPLVDWANNRIEFRISDPPLPAPPATAISAPPAISAPASWPLPPAPSIAISAPPAFLPPRPLRPLLPFRHCRRPDASPPMPQRPPSSAS